MHTLIAILKLYFPLCLTFFLLYVAFNLKKIESTSKIQISLGIFSTEIPLKNLFNAKLVMFIIVVFSCLLYYLTLDFTTFFPKKLRMTVHYDIKGTYELLESLKITEITDYKIQKNEAFRKEYITNIDNYTTKYLFKKNIFSRAILEHVNGVECQGFTSFIVKKERGIHKYFIEKAEGEVKFTFHEPNLPPWSTETKFSKTLSPNDKINFHIVKDLIKNKVILTPQFTEGIKNGKDGEIKLHHFLYGVTTLKIFPLPSFGNTLYLYQKGNVLVPVGYSVYTDQPQNDD